MDFFAPKYRRNPNEKVDSLYYGVSPNGGSASVVRVIKPSLDRNRMEVSETQVGPALPRGVGGLAGVLVLGGMETTLDEMEDILQARREKKFVPKRSTGEIVEMCRYLIERRNDTVKFLRKNPLERSKLKRTVRLHLPVGYRMAQTSEPGLKILARI